MGEYFGGVMSTVSVLPTPDDLWRAEEDFARRMASWRARRTGLSVDDLTQAALIGLWKAARDWDPERKAGTSFRTFASFVINHEMSHDSRAQHFLGANAARAEYSGKVKLPRRWGMVRQGGPDPWHDCGPVEMADLSLDDRDLVAYLIDSLPETPPAHPTLGRPSPVGIHFRTVARRCWLEGLPARTVAHQLGLREGTVCRWKRLAWDLMVESARALGL